MNGTVNWHSVQIWGTENPHVIVQHIRESPKISVFAAVSKFKIYGPFFFGEQNVRGDVHVDMLENSHLPQLDTDSENFI